MLEICQFQDTLRYGIKNSWTGIVLCKHRNHKPYSYKSKKRAIRKMNRLAKHFNKTIRSLSK